MHRVFPLNFAVPVLALFAASCASTQITNKWQKPGAPAAPYAKLLVVNINKQENVRRSVEDALVAQLKERGVEGIPSYALAPDAETLSGEEKADRVRQSGADAALVSRLVRVETRTEYTPAYYDPTVGFYNHWNGGWAGAYYPAAAYTYDIVYLETRLFDVKTEELVWAVGTETTDPGKLDKEISGYAKVILDALQNDGVLPPPAK